MSHIHLPDGILPAWLWLAGWVFIVILLLVFREYFKKDKMSSKIPLLGMLASIMIISMSLEIVPILYHINLSIVSGIILGPAWFILCSFVVNLILAFFGHGGITVVGLNSLIITTEGVLGYFLFRSLWLITKRIFLAGFLSAILTLFLSTFIALTIVALGTMDISSAFNIGHKEHLDTDKGLLKFETGESGEHSGELSTEFDFRKFAVLILGFGSIGWILEGLISGWILSYLHKVRPRIFEGV
ncbi:MAG: energy-coupling factor ABC transporter permease [candidate division Zixibacteria bacterium]|nr:energy-coupling factor ABC transporter permease [candidate division Zixibacteria bacterium]